MTILCYIERDDEYLILHRVSRKNDVNKGKWIGVGEHFENQESPEEYLLREVKGEAGLMLTSYRFRGLVTFIEKGWGMEYMCLYTADGYEREMILCNGENLEWVRRSELDNLNLWEGDRIFFRLLRDEAPFFSLKLRYQVNELVKAMLDGKALGLPQP